MPPKTEGTIGLNNCVALARFRDTGFSPPADLQARGKLTSLVWVEAQGGPQDAPTWTAVCKIDGVERGKGTGAQKYIAKDNAADQALAALKALE